eukprot:357839-Chlamydomonas_euryale.AAC.1
MCGDACRAGGAYALLTPSRGHGCMPLCMRVCPASRTHACPPSCMHACIHAFPPSCTHACMHSRPRARMHACMHASLCGHFNLGRAPVPTRPSLADDGTCALSTMAGRRSRGATGTKCGIVLRYGWRRRTTELALEGLPVHAMK